MDLCKLVVEREGELTEWSKVPHSKCGVRITSYRGFESLTLRRVNEKDVHKRASFFIYLEMRAFSAPGRVLCLGRLGLPGRLPFSECQVKALLHLTLRKEKRTICLSEFTQASKSLFFSLNKVPAAACWVSRWDCHRQCRCPRIPQPLSFFRTTILFHGTYQITNQPAITTI